MLVSERWQKDLSLISPDLENVILIDDRWNSIRGSGQRDFIKKPMPISIRCRAVKARRAATTAEAKSWIPDSYSEWSRDHRRFKRVQTILDEALSKRGPNRNLAEEVGRLNREYPDRMRSVKTRNPCLYEVLGSVL